MTVGTYRMAGDSVKIAVKAALEAGYRSIDTAAVYRNEKEIGEAITDALRSGLIKARSELFITSKIAPKDQGLEKSYEAIKTSLENLGPDVQYLDLMLIHWPGTQGEGQFVNGQMPLDDVGSIAARLGCTDAQVLLKWSMEKGCPVIPKSTHQKRIKENIEMLKVNLTKEVYFFS
jgi:diketogulonate reductase-like aldo/keto reductase